MQSVAFTLTANDANDQMNLRTWQILVDGAVIGDEQHWSGETMSAITSLSVGPYTIQVKILQDQGASYGTYSGTLTMNQTVFNFTGLDSSNQFSQNIWLLPQAYVIMPPFGFIFNFLAVRRQRLL